MKGHHLNPKQARFVQEYCISLNASDAARKAGYSVRSASRFCLELLTKPHIQDAIRREQAKYARLTHVSALRTLQELTAIGMSDIGHIVEQTEDGNLLVRKLDNIPEHIRRTISSIESTTEGVGLQQKRKVKVTMLSKLEAIKQLREMCGFDRKKLDEELAANAPETQTAMLDPETFNDEEWQAFMLLNKKRLAVIKANGGV